MKVVTIFQCYHPDFVRKLGIANIAQDKDGVGATPLAFVIGRVFGPFDDEASAATWVNSDDGEHAAMHLLTDARELFQCEPLMMCGMEPVNSPADPCATQERIIHALSTDPNAN